jgi:hypothetical protein
MHRLKQQPTAAGYPHSRDTDSFTVTGHRTLLRVIHRRGFVRSVMDMLIKVMNLCRKKNGYLKLMNITITHSRLRTKEVDFTAAAQEKLPRILSA